MFKAEFTTAGDGGSYATNGLMFATRDEAEAYAYSLACRWTAVRDWRIREATAEEAARDSLADSRGMPKKIDDSPAEASEKTEAAYDPDLPYDTATQRIKADRA